MDNIHDKVECKKTDPAQADTNEPQEHDRRALGVMTFILGKNMLTRFSEEHADTIQHGGNTDRAR